MRPSRRGLTTHLGHGPTHVHRPELPIDTGIALLHQGQNPLGTHTQAQPTRGPGSESAGYHGDLTIPGYQPKTPTTAPTEEQASVTPAEIGTATAGADYHRAVRHLPTPARLVTLSAFTNPLHPTEAPAPVQTPTQGLAEILGRALGSISAPGTAGPTSPAISDAPFTADQLHPTHQQTPEEAHHQEVVEHAGIQGGAKLEQLYGPHRYGGPAPNEGSGRPATPAKGPASTAVISSRRPTAARPADAARDPLDPLGKKTLGDVTQAQLVQAAKAGTLNISKGGVLTTPTGRQDVAALRQARHAVANSGPDLQSLHQQFPELNLSTLRAYRASQRQTGVPPALLAGIEGQESNYGQSTLPGVRSGANSAGASGPFQIGTGGGAAGDWWGEHMPPGADPYNDRTAAVAAGKYLTEAGATKDPSTWFDAAFSYNHADWYAEKAVQIANEHKALNKVGLPPDPTAVEALQAAKAHAKADGINPTPFNGDVEGGEGEYTWVRADAKGMLGWAASAVGTAEGTAKAERWGKRFGLNTVSQPWCANFTSNGLVRRGFAEDELPAEPNYVPSYEQWAEEGKHASVVKGGIAAAKPGDLLAFEGEHIGIYKGNNEMISGNSGDAVSVTSAEDGGLGVMVIRPHYKGGKVKVKDGSLPGSTASTATSSGGEASSSTGTAPSGPGAPAESGGQAAPAAPSELIALSNPFANGPTMPTIPVAQEEQEQRTSDLHENLLQLLGEEEGSGVRGRPYLPA